MQQRMQRRNSGSGLVWLGAIALLLVAGCSSFERDWRATLEQPIPEDEITGPWIGTWESEDGHSGRLRAVVTRTAESEYEAHYHAVYWRIFTFQHAMTLSAERENGRVLLSGEVDAGRLGGGVYTYEGHATPEEFFSTYESARHRGTYRMTRPEGAPADADAAP